MAGKSDCNACEVCGDANSAYHCGDYPDCTGSQDPDCACDINTDSNAGAMGLSLTDISRVQCNFDQGPGKCTKCPDAQYQLGGVCVPCADDCGTGECRPNCGNTDAGSCLPCVTGKFKAC